MRATIPVLRKSGDYPPSRCSCFVSLFYVLIFAITAFSATKPRVLVFTETVEWDHGTRAAANAAIAALGATGGFFVDTASSTDGYFTDAALAGYAAVCFVNTTGNFFTDAEAGVFRRYMEAGGGYVGVHASVDAEYGRPWYGEMTGANFNGHPFDITTAKVAVLDKRHPSTRFIVADTLTFTDEWYFWADNPGFKNNPVVDPAHNPDVTVLMNLVESSIAGSTLNGYHPICWCKGYGSGRVWYTGFGHNPQTFTDTLFRNMLLGGIRYAAGMEGTRVVQVKEQGKVNASVQVAPWDVRGVRVFDIRGRLVGGGLTDASDAILVKFVNSVGRRGGGNIGTGCFEVVASPGRDRKVWTIIVKK